MPVDVMIGTKHNGSSDGYRSFTKQCRSSWKRVRCYIRLDMISTESTTNFRLVTRCGSISARIELRGKARNCDQSRMVHLPYWRRLGITLDFPIYIQMYSIVNVEKSETL